MIRNILVIIIGLILFFFPYPFTFLLTAFGEGKLHPIFLDIYLMASFLLIGVFVGWFGKAKGWILALILSILILVTILYGSSMGRTDGKISDLKIFFDFKVIINILAAIVGGYIGERFLRKKWPLSLSMRLNKNDMK